jgi:hypothetical protein
MSSGSESPRNGSAATSTSTAASMVADADDTVTATVTVTDSDSDSDCDVEMQYKYLMAEAMESLDSLLHETDMLTQQQSHSNNQKLEVTHLRLS